MNQAMNTLSNERICYFNGDYIPESRALAPYRDRSFLYGDAAFDMTRTFRHKIFRLETHIDRFYDSMRALRLDPGIKPDEIIEITKRLIDAYVAMVDCNFVEPYLGKLQDTASR